MKICLINPPRKNLFLQNQQFPLGILYVAAILEQNNYDIFIINLSNTEEYQWENLITEADIYGLTATYLDYPVCEKIAAVIKKKYPNSKIVLGGPHPTTAPEMVNFSLFNSIVIGEGEASIINLIKDYEINNSRQKYISPLIKNLDSIPYPARHLLPKETITTPSVFAYGEKISKGLATSIITSRGCAYDCKFCASRKIWGCKLRFHSVDYVIGEIKELIDKYGITQLRAQDDTMSLNKPRLIKLCNELAKLNIIFRCSLRVDTVDEEILNVLKNAGCKEIGYGVESADQKVLDILNKKTTVEQNYKAIKITKEAGIITRIFLMTGTPGETSYTIDKNIEFIEKAKPDMVTLNLFAPLPGCEIWDSPEKFNCKILTRDYKAFCFNMSANKESVPNVLNLNITLEEMTSNINKMRKYIFSKGIANLGK
jgi:radical SAM superfamily enzyme YgiQ (UPF0313 family)